MLKTPRSRTIVSILFLVFCIVFACLQNANAQTDTPAIQMPADTLAGKVKATRLINQNFDDVYMQNARISIFGKETGNPIPTQLVADLTGNFVVFSTPVSRFAFIFNPRVKLRLLNTPGAPVKSPSYMPGGTLYYRVNSNYYKPSFLTLSYSHHSNGIRGKTLNPNGTFNTDSGKFTTNFYTLTYTHGKRVDRTKTISNRYETIGLEIHSAVFGLGYSPALKDQYGFVRMNGTWMYNLSKARTDAVTHQNRTFNNWMRLQIDFSYIMDKYNNYSITNVSKRLNVNVLYCYQFPFMQNVALMTGGGYRGQDDYNIFFQNSYPYLTIGFAAGVSFGFHHK